MNDFIPRKTSFVLGATEHGPMIINRHDYRLLAGGGGYGVGLQLLERGVYDPDQCRASLEILALRRQHYGDGVVAVDVGANIGAFVLSWARAMTGWGSVLAIEPQEPLFYALCGNIALNNLANVRAVWAALGASDGFIEVPALNYDMPGSFGSLELRDRIEAEPIGQAVDYTDTVETRLRTLDSLLGNMELPRLDLLKIDVEGMELEVIDGAWETIKRCRPAVIVEWIKTKAEALRETLTALDYVVYDMGMDLLALHQADPLREAIRP